MKVTIMPGPCKLMTTVTAKMIDSDTVGLKIDTECGFYKPLEEELTEVDTMELFGRLGEGQVYEACRKYCHHATCTVAAGILKAVEACAKMALPVNVTITVEREEGE